MTLHIGYYPKTSTPTYTARNNCFNPETALVKVDGSKVLVMISIA